MPLMVAPLGDKLILKELELVNNEPRVSSNISLKMELFGRVFISDYHFHLLNYLSHFQ